MTDISTVANALNVKYYAYNTLRQEIAEQSLTLLALLAREELPNAVFIGLADGDQDMSGYQTVVSIIVDAGVLEVDDDDHVDTLMEEGCSSNLDDASAYVWNPFCTSMLDPELDKMLHEIDGHAERFLDITAILTGQPATVATP